MDLRTAFFVLAAVVMAAPVVAQGEKSQPLAISAGIMWPGDNALKDDIGKTWLNVNLHYTVGINYERQARAEVTLGYAQRSEGNLDGNIVPITWDITWSKPVENRTASSYYGVGAGACWLNYDAPSGGDSDWGVAANFRVGVQWNNGVFAEARYLWTDSIVGGIEGSGLSLTVGTRLKL
jgi:hypothetical protein